MLKTKMHLKLQFSPCIICTLYIQHTTPILRQPNIHSKVYLLHHLAFAMFLLFCCTYMEYGYALIRLLGFRLLEKSISMSIQCIVCRDGSFAYVVALIDAGNQELKVLIFKFEFR